MTYFFQVNRVEHQKLNQATPYDAVWLSFCKSTGPSADAVDELVPVILTGYPGRIADI